LNKEKKENLKMVLCEYNDIQYKKGENFDFYEYYKTFNTNRT